MDKIKSQFKSQFSPVPFSTDYSVSLVNMSHCVSSICYESHVLTWFQHELILTTKIPFNTQDLIS